MSFGVELVLSNNVHAARRNGQQIDRLNRARKRVEGMKQEAMALAGALVGKDDLPSGLAPVPTWLAQGVIGILASRKDKYHRPVIAFADGGKAASRFMSARFRVCMRDALDRIDTQNWAWSWSLVAMRWRPVWPLWKRLRAIHSKMFDDVVRKS